MRLVQLYLLSQDALALRRPARNVLLFYYYCLPLSLEIHTTDDKLITVKCIFYNRRKKKLNGRNLKSVFVRLNNSYENDTIDRWLLIFYENKSHYIQRTRGAHNQLIAGKRCGERLWALQVTAAAAGCLVRFVRFPASRDRTWPTGTPRSRPVVGTAGDRYAIYTTTGCK